MSKARFEFRWEDQFNLASTRLPPALITMKPCRKSQVSRPFLLHVWAEILLDENQPGVRDYAATQTIEMGMADMSETSVPEAEKSTCVRRKRDVSADFPPVPFRSGLYPVVDSVQ